MNLKEKSSKKSSLIINTVFSTLSRASEVVFLLLMILAARFLGEDGFGKFSFALALTSMFIFTTDMGLKTYLIREVARNKEKAVILLGNAVTLKIFLSILTVIILLLIASMLPHSREVLIVVYLMTIYMVSKSFKLIYRSIIVAYERFELETLAVSIERVLFIVLGSIVLVRGYGLIAFAVVFSAVGVLNLVITIILVKKYLIKPRIFADIGIIKKLFIESTPFWLTSGAFHLYFRLDSVMLSMMRNDAEVGWYTAAYRLIEGLIVVPMIIYNVIFPRLSVLHQESKSKVENISIFSCKYLIAISLPITFLGLINAKPLMLLIYGSAYSETVYAWQILLFGLSFVFLWNIFIVILNSINHPKVPFYGALLGTIVNVLLNFVLIPLYGYIGASISTLVSEIVLFIFLLVALTKIGYKFNFVKYSVRPLLATILSIAVIYLIDSDSALIITAVGGVSYFALLFILGFFEEDEKRLYAELKTTLLKKVIKAN